MSLESLDHIVSGALYDFLGWATARKEELVLSDQADCGLVIDALQKFAALRGLDINYPVISYWQARCGGRNKMPNLVPMALDILKEELQDQEYARAWHANIAVCMQDEGCPYNASNRAAARFMYILFGIDTSDLYEKQPEDICLKDGDVEWKEI